MSADHPALDRDRDRDRDAPRKDARLFLGVLVLVGYGLAARGVENLYPFSVFPMYAGTAEAATSRIMARTEGGAVVEVTAFAAWSCEALPSLETTSCHDIRGIPYIDREREAYVREHPLGERSGEPVTLVRRVFSFDGKSRPEACPVAQCRAGH